MTTGRIPSWNAQGVLPPIAVREHDRPEEQRLLAERSVLRFLLGDTSVGMSQRRDFLQERLNKIERQLEVNQSSAGASARVTVDLSEERLTFVGRFQGILPTCGEFEFLPVNATAPIHGYLSFSSTDAGQLNRHLGRLARIGVIATRSADGPPCFRLIAVHECSDDEPGSSMMQNLPPSDS